MLVREWPYHGRPAPLPMLIGWNRDEARFWYDLKDADGTVISPMRAPETEEALVEQVGRLIRLYYPFAAPPQAGDVIAAYADPSGPLDADAVWSDIYTDLVFRGPIFHYAAKHAAADAPTFIYEFGYPLPHPGRGTPHAADVPFVFGTTAHPHLAGKVGHGDEVAALSGCHDGHVGVVHAFGRSVHACRRPVGPLCNRRSRRSCVWNPRATSGWCLSRAPSSYAAGRHSVAEGRRSRATAAGGTPPQKPARGPPATRQAKEGPSPSGDGPLL